MALRTLRVPVALRRSRDNPKTRQWRLPLCDFGAGGFQRPRRSETRATEIVRVSDDSIVQEKNRCRACPCSTQIGSEPDDAELSRFGYADCDQCEFTELADTDSEQYEFNRS